MLARETPRPGGVVAIVPGLVQNRGCIEVWKAVYYEGSEVDIDDLKAYYDLAPRAPALLKDVRES